MAKTKVEKKAKRKKRKNAIEIRSDRYKWLSKYEEKILTRGGYFDSEGSLHNVEGCVRCTTMVRSIGTRCRNFAVPGETSCHIHGGVRARAKAGKRRIYSAFIQDPKLKSVMKNIESSNEFTGLAEELSLLRGLLALQLDNPENLGLDEVKEISRIIGEIRGLVEGCVKIETKLGKLIDINQVKVVIETLTKILRENVRDTELLKRIAIEFEKRVLWPSALASTPQPEAIVSV